MLSAEVSPGELGKRSGVRRVNNPYELATWRLRNHILHDTGDLWTKTANYHSRTPLYNAVYRAKLKVAAKRWAGWLVQHFTTRIASNK